MKISNKIKAFMEKAAQGDGYWVNKAKLAFAVALEERRKKAGMSYKDMAEKMESSPAYMTKVFRGDANLTIESMVKLARCTGGQLQLEIADTEAAHAPWDISSIRNTRGTNTQRGVWNAIGTGTIIQVDFGAANHDFQEAKTPLAA